MGEPLSLGRVITRTYSVLRRRWLWLLVLLPPLTWLPPILLGPFDKSLAGQTGLVSNIADVIGTALMTGLIASVVLRDARGQSGRPLLSELRPAAMALLAAALVFEAPGLVVNYVRFTLLQPEMVRSAESISAIGLKMLAIGLAAIAVTTLLTMAFGLAAAVAVAEGAGPAQAFGRARALSQGVRWKIGGLSLLWDVARTVPLVLLVSFLPVLIMSATPDHYAEMLGSGVMDAVRQGRQIIGAILYAVWPVMTVVVYLERAGLPDRPPPATRTADVFD